MGKAETRIQNGIIECLKLRDFAFIEPKNLKEIAMLMGQTNCTYRGIFWRTNTGVMKQDNRFIRFNIPGQPDLMGFQTITSMIGFPTPPDSRPMSMPFGIEVKAKRGVQTPEQMCWELIYKNLGAKYVLARSVEDVERAF